MKKYSFHIYFADGTDEISRGFSMFEAIISAKSKRIASGREYRVDYFYAQNGRNPQQKHFFEWQIISELLP